MSEHEEDIVYIPDAYDWFLALGSTFDIITPTISFIKDLANKFEIYTFFVPYGCGWSGMDVCQLLHNHGIPTWGHMTVNWRFMITVPGDLADEALKILSAKHVPLENS